MNYVYFLKGSIKKPLPQIELIDMVEEMKAHHYEVLSKEDES